MVARKGEKMKILIIRFSSFGDVVLTTPVIRKIKEEYPHAEIDFIVYSNFSEGISLNPNIKELIIFDKKRSKDREYIGKMIENLMQKDYDYILDLHSKILSRIIGKGLAKGKTKYFRYKKRKWWKTLLVKAKLITYKADCTIVESYFTALKRLGIYFDRHNIKEGKGDDLEFYIDDKMEKDFSEKYRLKDIEYFVLAPGASKFTKKWPYYNELAQELLEKTKAEIFVIGGPEDYDSIKEDQDKRIVNLCGKVSFKESGIILKYADFAVVNDSGPFHISRALGTKTFVFFGPTDPKLFSFEKNTFLLNNPDCPPHSLYGEDKFAKKYENCMKGITLETVVDRIMEEYNRKREYIGDEV